MVRTQEDVSRSAQPTSEGLQPLRGAYHGAKWLGLFCYYLFSRNLPSPTWQAQTEIRTLQGGCGRKSNGESLLCWPLLSVLPLGTLSPLPVVQGLLVRVVLSLPGPSRQNLWGQALFSLGLLTWPKMSLVLGIPAGPEVKTECFHCRGYGFYLWSGSQEPICCAGTVKNIKKMESCTIWIHYGIQQRKPRW